MPILVKVYQQLNNIEDIFWKNQKQKEIQNLIVGCAGIFLEATPAEYAVAGGEKLKVTTSIIKRSEVTVKLERLQFLSVGKDSMMSVDLKNNVVQNLVSNIEIPKNLPKQAILLVRLGYKSRKNRRLLAFLLGWLYVMVGLIFL